MCVCVRACVRACGCVCMRVHACFRVFIYVHACAHERVCWCVVSLVCMRVCAWEMWVRLRVLATVRLPDFVCGIGSM